MSDILVTGGAGYIGAHIVDSLCDVGFDVVVLDNLSNGYKENLNTKAKFSLGDIRNKTDLEFIFSNHKITSIIHMAAFKSVDKSMDNPSKYTYNKNLNFFISVWYRFFI